MLRFGHKLQFILWILISITSSSCAAVDSGHCREYSEKEMGRLATLVRVTMDIVSGSYVGGQAPTIVSEDRIKEIVGNRNATFPELVMLDQYELAMVSQNGQWAAVVWNPKDDQRLIQDLRCTMKLDEASWKSCVHGHSLTLDWHVCD